MAAGSVFIYALTDPVTGEDRYVGKAKDINARRKAHIRDAKRRDTPVYEWVRGLLSQGLEPGIRLLETAPSDDWERAEIDWIARLRKSGNILNVANGGNQPQCSHEMSVRIGRHSARTRDPVIFSLNQKMGISLKRGWVSETTKEKLRYAARKRPDLFGQYADI